MQRLPIFMPAVGTRPFNSISKGYAGADVIRQSLTNVSTYTVPAGKVLAVHAIRSTVNSAVFTADGISILFFSSSNNILASKMRRYYDGSLGLLKGNNQWLSATPTYFPANPVGTNNSVSIADYADYLYCFKAGVVLAATVTGAIHLLGTLHDA